MFVPLAALVLPSIIGMPPFTLLRESFARCSAEAPEGKRQMRRYAQIGTSKALHSTTDIRCACRSEMNEGTCFRPSGDRAAMPLP